MPQNKIFVDTSAWYAIIDKNDRDHAVAATKIQVFDRPLVTSNYIFDEILTLLKAKLGFTVAKSYGIKKFRPWFE
jgi:predicted nucleic acid-binding protein